MIREARTTDIGDIRALMNSVAGFWDASWRMAPPSMASSPRTISASGRIEQLVVAPQAQRRGIGARPLGEIERRVAECGRAVIVADVWQDAEQLYRSHGWTPPPVILVRKHLPSACANR